jgi:hypothetical protein
VLEAEPTPLTVAITSSSSICEQLSMHKASKVLDNQNSRFSAFDKSDICPIMSSCVLSTHEK